MYSALDVSVKAYILGYHSSIGGFRAPRKRAETSRREVVGQWLDRSRTPLPTSGTWIHSESWAIEGSVRARQAKFLPRVNRRSVFRPSLRNWPRIFLCRKLETWDETSHSDDPWDAGVELRFNARRDGGSIRRSYHVTMQKISSRSYKPGVYPLSGEHVKLYWATRVSFPAK